MAPSSDTQALLALVKLSRDLLNQHLTLLNPDRPSSALSDDISTNNPPNPLQVLRDASLLLKSHTTKLSLLLLTPPFTPSAISSVLRQITTTCLPALMSAVQLARPEIWSRILRREICARVGRVLREVAVFLAEIEMVTIEHAAGRTVRTKGAGSGKVGSRGGGGGGGGSGRDTLASTGVVWEACDAVMALEELDVGGVALIKAQEYAELVKDAIAELREWREESLAAHRADDDSEDEDEHEDEDEDDIFGTTQLLPKDRPELVVQLDKALDILRKIEFLFAAVVKRRLKTFDKGVARVEDHVQALDTVMDLLKTIPAGTDELASAFYELDEESIGNQERAILGSSRNILSRLARDWNGKDDQFTEWAHKWLEVVK